MHVSTYIYICIYYIHIYIHTIDIYIYTYNYIYIYISIHVYVLLYNICKMELLGSLDQAVQIMDYGPLTKVFRKSPYVFYYRVEPVFKVYQPWFLWAPCDVYMGASQNQGPNIDPKGPSIDPKSSQNHDSAGQWLLLV